jgi:hypothetical protein
MKVMTIRIDDELHADVTQAAQADGRSVNREIAYLLRAALEQRDKRDNATT